jgi:hypothetical protein
LLLLKKRWDPAAGLGYRTSTPNSSSGSLNLDPAEIRFFLNTTYDFEAQKKRKA